MISYHSTGMISYHIQEWYRIIHSTGMISYHIQVDIVSDTGWYRIIYMNDIVSHPVQEWYRIIYRRISYHTRNDIISYTLQECYRIIYRSDFVSYTVQVYDIVSYTWMISYHTLHRNDFVSFIIQEWYRVIHHEDAEIQSNACGSSAEAQTWLTSRWGRMGHQVWSLRYIGRNGGIGLRVTTEGPMGQIEGNRRSGRIDSTLRLGLMIWGIEKCCFATRPSKLISRAW